MNNEELDSLRVALSPETRTAMAVILAGMMFTVALSLKVEDFTALRKQPGRILGGAATQILGLPLLTMGLILLLKPGASIALGMLVVASCPGGNMSNVLTHFARGNTAYSVSLTAISSVMAALVTPVSILFWSSLYPPTAALVHALNVEPGPFLTQTAMLLTVPLALGMLVAARFPGTADRLRSVLSPLSLATLAAIVVIGVYSNWGLVLAAGAVIVPLTVLHNASAFLLGSTTARVLRLDIARRRSLTFEVGIQNSGLGLLILLNQFDGLGGAAALTAMWSVWHLIAGSALAGVFRYTDYRYNKNSNIKNTNAGG